MSKKDDGGPAFPILSHGSGDGMSLRDWFAGMAIRAVYADAKGGTPFSTLATKAYNMADAMLEERKK